MICRKILHLSGVGLIALFSLQCTDDEASDTKGGVSPQPDAAADFDSTVPADAATADTSASDTATAAATDTGVADAASLAPLPDPPTQPEPFTLTCPKASFSDAQRQWLEQTPHCYGSGEPIFEDATLQSDLAHTHDTSVATSYYGKLVGGGVAVADFNNDGALDLYASNASGPNRLFLNDGSGAFLDCTSVTELAFAESWTNGVSAADYDNDGWQDLYLANRGPDKLLRNRGDGTFEDVTLQAGVSADGNSGTVSWGDVDADGDLDLVIASLAQDILAQNGEGIEPGQTHVYINAGDGTFDEPASPQVPDGSSFLAPLLDLDDDGDLDLLVTQEIFQKFPPTYFRNDGVDAQGNVQWVESFDARRHPIAHAVMGLAPFDINADGALDLAMSNLWTQLPHREVLLENRGEDGFVDVTLERNGFGMDNGYRPGTSNRLVSWATIAEDFDNDADEDLYFSYGHFSAGDDFAPTVDEYPVMGPYQHNALLDNGGEGDFTLLEGTCAEDAGQSRAAVAADFDRDGCLDLVVVNQRGNLRLLRNRCTQDAQSVTVRLIGRNSNRDAVGARVELSAAERRQHKRVFAGSNSVHSSAPKELHFGLGTATQAERLDIWWPSGAHQAFGPIPPGRVVVEEPNSTDN